MPLSWFCHEAAQFLIVILITNCSRSPFKKNMYYPTVYFDRKELECAKFLENLEDINYFRQAITTLPCVYNWNRTRTAAVANEAVTETIRAQR